MPDLLVAALVGSLVGLVMGVFGAGGGVITVPAFVYLLDFEPRVATVAALITGIITAGTTMAGHARHGRVRVKHGLTFAALGFVGNAAGAALSWLGDQDLFMLAFGVLIFIAAGLMGFNSRVLRRRARPDRLENDPPALRITPSFVGWGLLVGALTGFYGIGAGFIVVPILVLAMKFPMRAAAGTSLLVIMTANLFALAARLPLAAHTGDLAEIQWMVIGIFAVFSVIVGQVGVRLSTRLPDRILADSFVVLLVLLGGSIIVQAVAAA